MIKSLDHFVLTTTDERKCLDFYVGVLGMKLERYGDNRIALLYGDQKINVHQPGAVIGLKAVHPTPGSLDFCFLADVPIEEVVARLKAHDVKIIEGPSVRTGARFPIMSVYCRDPDQNLVEISVPA